MKAWIEQELKSARGKRVLNMYARMRMSGSYDFDVLGNIYRPNQKIPQATVKRLIKQEEFQLAVNEEIMNILTEKGVTKEWLVKMRKEIADKALKDGRYKDSLEALDKFEDMQEMTPKPTRIVQTDQITLQHKETKMLDSVTVTSTKETDSHNEITEDNPDERQNDSDKQDKESDNDDS